MRIGFGGGLYCSIGDVTVRTAGLSGMNCGNSAVVSDPGSLWDVAGIHAGYSPKADLAVAASPTIS